MIARILISASTYVYKQILLSPPPRRLGKNSDGAHFFIPPRSQWSLSPPSD
jgi:hypothetical protein